MADPLAAAIKADKLLAEEACLARLLDTRPYDADTARLIEAQAADWVERLRTETSQHTLLDTFLAEYGLSNDEGVALMCLAEAFLRVPDSDTLELLLKDKLAPGDWEAHLGHADSWLVNSSTWALLLTGRTLGLQTGADPADWFNSLINKLGAPLMLRAVRTAMQILGREFVLGETIDEALARSSADATTRYSFDMLGEGARDRASAERYLQAYRQAIETVAATDAGAGHSVSVKLSALHPRFTPLQQAAVQAELLDTLEGLCRLARQHDVALSLDAEESERVQFSLELFAALKRRMPDWAGLGMVVQAYGKRAPAILDWLASLARHSGSCIPVRLVKGAYWDAEIKRAQELGLAAYPVYTRKSLTDAAYLVCAAKLFAHAGDLYPQFATHNAHTVAAVLALAGEQTGFEFQRLHGMGEHLYEVVRRDRPGLNIRVYAPVGGYADLLAYLVRRLLENGANSSFVNRLLDAQLPASKLVKDPFTRLGELDEAANPNIPLPAALYGLRRSNSAGVDFSDLDALAEVWPTQPPEAAPLTAAAAVPPAADTPFAARLSPADTRQALGAVREFAAASLDDAFAQAVQAQPAWDALGGEARAAHLERLADLLESNLSKLLQLLCFEAGKTVEDGVNEVREAVDFCRYYAARGRYQFGEALSLPGPTGETNELSLHGRGVFVCISPWNFPLAIFLGQISAALMAGNAVIAKPAEPTPAIARLAVELMRAAGIDESVCQLVFGGAALGEALVAHADCAGVAFTGSTAVAQQINRQLAQRAGPICPLIAETGGQNAMIVDSTALLEQVVDDVVRSAFMSAGQRCSALRVLCLQLEIADPVLTLLKGAMNELRVGHPMAFSTDLGPIISAPALERLTSYLAACRRRGLEVFSPDLDACPPGHYLAPTLVEIQSLKDLDGEQFGPILHVLRFDADQLDELIAAINALGFGLTFGLHTRLDQRAAEVADAVRAGNVYVNRNITGAVVGTQPFGGQGLSGTGPKAGGPHYLLRFAVEKTITTNVTATGGNLGLLSGA